MTHSLRLRLLLLWALAIVFALGAAGVVLTALFSQHLERAAVRRMTDDLNRLAETCVLQSNHLRTIRPRDPFYPRTGAIVSLVLPGT